MKKIIIMLLAFLSMTTDSYAGGEAVLKPTSCTVGDRPFYHVLGSIGFNFSEGIAVKEQSEASVYCDDKIVVTGKMSAHNTKGENKTYGTLVVDFDSINLEKGKHYTLVVPAGTVSSLTDKNSVNEELRTDFFVPEHIAFTNADMRKTDDKVVEEQRFTFFFNTEIENIGSPNMILYREDVPVRTLPVNTAWDWDLGQSSIDFGKAMHFEDGVNYSLVLPEGSVRSIYRSDITNKAIRVDFVGGYTQPLPTINYTWCSLLDNRKFDTLNEVYFVYDQPIIAAPDALIELRDSKEKVIAQEKPFVKEENNKWYLTVDFHGIAVEQEGFSIVIPAGAVLSATGDVVVNERKSVGGNTPTAIQQTVDKTASVQCKDNMLVMDNLGTGTTVTVYTIEGKVYAQTVAQASQLSIPLANKGVYLVKLNNTIVKIYNR